MSGWRSVPARAANRLHRLRNPGPVQARDARVPRLRQRVTELSDEVGRLSNRVEHLEVELLEAQSQGRRVGEISDLVTELLANEASRRDPEFQQIVGKFASERRG